LPAGMQQHQQQQQQGRQEGGDGELQAKLQGLLGSLMPR
jgi:hypothetical protein